MKLVKENINEIFTKDSDPIEDLQIGIPEIRELNKKIKKIGNLLKNDFKNLDFHDAVLTIDSLRNIVPISIVLFFNEKYNLNCKLEEHFYGGTTFAKGTKNNYKFYFTISNSFMSVDINIYKIGGGMWSTPYCRSIKRLEQSFLQICKKNNIKI